MSNEPLSRTVAIVGRPNVGKSALFNRIARKRIAIVHDQSGVTRDRLMREVSWEEQRFNLIDTGGMRLFDGERESDTIERSVRAQVDVAIEDAAAVILVVDVMAGIHPADEEIARLIHKSGRPCVIAVNKCDLPRHEDAGFHDFARLNLPLFPVSAQHNHGMEPLMEAVVAHLPPPVEDPSASRPLRVAIVGRPNAGKSSYINRLLHSERVIVSDVAGTTRDAIDVPFTIGAGKSARHYTLVDTAGMRHVHKIDTSVERFSLFRSEEAIRECDVAVLVMDAELGPTTQDKYIASMIIKERKGCVLLMNKWDIARAAGVTETKAEPNLRGLLPFLTHCPVLFMSAQEGYNVRKSIELIDEVAAHMQTKLPTGLLNRTLEAAMTRTTIPNRFGKHLRMYYATQTGFNPMIIRIFVNDAKIVNNPFTQYLVKTIREEFNLVGTPVVLQFRSRTRPDGSTSALGSGGGGLSPEEQTEAAPGTRKKLAPKKTFAEKSKPQRKGNARKTPSTAQGRVAKKNPGGKSKKR